MKISIKFFSLSALLSLVAFGGLSCSSNELEPENSVVERPVIVKNGGVDKISSLVQGLYRQNPFATKDEISVLVDKEFGVHNDKTEFRSIKSKEVSEEAKVVLSKMMEVDPSLHLTKTSYVECLLGIVTDENNGLSVSEVNALKLSCYISADLIELKYGNTEELRGIAEWLRDKSEEAKKWVKKQWNDWGRCTAGIVGGTGSGALVGAGVGSAVPVLGTTAGAITGGISGGLTGAAAAC